MLCSLMLVIVLVMALVCVGCPDNSSNNKQVEQREFYIESHEIYGVYYPCWALDQPQDSGGASYKISEDEVQKEDEVYIIRPGSGYMVHLKYFNDHANTEWVQFEIFVDGKRYSSSGSTLYPFFKKHAEPEQEGETYIELFRYTPWYLQGKEISVDVWLEDEEGIKSEVYTFDVSIINIWY